MRKFLMFATMAVLAAGLCFAGERWAYNASDADNRIQDAIDAINPGGDALVVASITTATINATGAVEMDSTLNVDGAIGAGGAITGASTLAVGTSATVGTDLTLGKRFKINLAAQVVTNLAL